MNEWVKKKKSVYGKEFIFIHKEIQNYAIIKKWIKIEIITLIKIIRVLEERRHLFSHKIL